MSRKKRKNGRQQKKSTESKLRKPFSVVFQCSALQQIRRHARCEIKTEICGVLIGHHSSGRTEIVGSIEGRGADQGEAHVTFTQETWTRIHDEKEERYPTEAIVGWYHSHPGFGVFLSDHDTFIHENFFSGEGQVAWVYDPVSEEEGCFGWEQDEVARIQRYQVLSDNAPQIVGNPGPSNSGVETTSAGKDQDTPYTFGELGHDLMMMVFGGFFVLAAVLVWTWMTPRQPSILLGHPTSGKGQYITIPIDQIRFPQQPPNRPLKPPIKDNKRDTPEDDAATSAGPGSAETGGPHEQQRQ